MNEAFPIIFGILFCSVFVWFYLCNRMFKILRTRHPEKYEAMGKPGLIMNNSLSNNISFMKFLFKREWQELNDAGLASLGKGMLIFCVIYLALFLGLLVGFPIGISP
jgi:hypothetical protein